jgi:two-component system, cell cycle sensor histidine kinase and response regulator CckA
MIDIADQQDNATHGQKVPGHILVVDDEPAVLGLIERFLQSWGFSTSAALSEMDCLNVWQQHKDEISAAIIDLRLSASDGRTIGRILQNQKPDLKIIYMSGYPVEEFQDSTLVRGINFVSKPFELDMLRNLL